MNPVLPDEALELAAAAAKAFDGAEDVAAVLDALGIGDLDPRADEVARACAAALCEVAGRVALPYPLAGALVRDAEGRPTAAVPDSVARVDHGDRFPQWRVGTFGGAAHLAGGGRPLGSKLGPHVCDLELGKPIDLPEADLLLQQTLVAWTVLGALDRAVELAVEHVNGRIQFGKPLAAFQAVQFQLADAAVAVAGLRELAGFTLWRGGRADVLALRLHACEVARTVLRTAQQLHGAAGVCDEYDVSVLTRYVQPLIRLPFGADRAAAELAASAMADGFDGLFPHGGTR